MAADLCIHVMTDDMTEADLECFFKNTLGTRYFSWFNNNNCKFGEDELFCSHDKRVAESPKVWVGEVSWLKEQFLGGGFVPDVVAQVSTLIDGPTPITDSLIETIHKAFGAAQAHGFYDTADEPEVIAFLKEHKGKVAFTVSW